MTKRQIIGEDARDNKSSKPGSYSIALAGRATVASEPQKKNRATRNLSLLLLPAIVSITLSIVLSILLLSTLPRQALAETNVDNLNEYGLLFDTSSGIFYLDLNGNGAIDAGEPVYNPPSGTATWASSTNTLTLNGFNWSSSAPTAFREVNPSYTTPLTLNLSGANSITSTYSGNGYTHGMFMSSPELVIIGDGELIVTGGELVGAGSYNTEGINAGNITIKGGKFCAYGGNGVGVSVGIGARSLTVEGGVLKVEGGNAAASFGAWTGEITVSGGALFACGNTAHWGDSKGLVLSVFTFEGGIIETKGESGALGYDPYSSTPKAMTISAPAYSYSANTALPLAETLIQVYSGTGSGAPYVYKDSHLYVGLETLTVYDVNVSADKGGTVSAISGQYPAGYSLSITATANSGHSFSGWTVTGVKLADPSATTITISVPQENVTLVAGFKAGDKASFGTDDGSGRYLVVALCLIILAGILVSFFLVRRKKLSRK